MTTKSTARSNHDKLRKLLSRPKGVTLDTICKTTQWQPHSARAAISRLRKSGLPIERAFASNRPSSTYRIVPAETPSSADE